jgi:hypothetical protein
MHKEVAFFCENLSAIRIRAFEWVLTRMVGTHVEIKTGSPGERLETAVHWTAVSLGTCVGHLMVLEVLFEFEGLVTVWIRAHIFSVWKLLF